MKKPIIGITEAGDAAIDFSWVERLDGVDGAIIITKNPTELFRKRLLPYSDKCILHATITGWSGTKVEPHVPVWRDALTAVKRFTDTQGFPRDHVVIRVDPIIPTELGIALAKRVIETAYAFGFRRFRVSVLDMYPHIRERLGAIIPDLLPLYDGFDATDEAMGAVNEMLKSLRRNPEYQDITIETCAELRLKHVRHCGCVSAYDMQILNIPYDEIDEGGYQRKGCMCYSGKQELLTNKNRCPHGCLYCYWKDGNI